MQKECCHKTKERDESEIRRLTNRLSRIEGQIRGIRSMVENNAYCVDILTQASAASAALSSFARELLESHIRGCVTEDIRAGRDDSMEELLETLRKFL